MFFPFTSPNNQRSIWQAAKSFWKVNSQAGNQVQLTVEALEDRTTPTVTITQLEDTIRIENAPDGNESIKILVDREGKLEVTSAVSPPVDGGGGEVDGLTWTSELSTDKIGLKNIIIQTDPGKFLDVLKGTDLGGADTLRNVVYKGSQVTLGEFVDFSENKNDQIYLRMNSGQGADFISTSPTGINIIEYSDSAEVSVQILKIPEDHKVALDFSRLTLESGSVNLNLAEANLQIGGYRNMSINLETPFNTAFIDVLVGGPGNDLLIGNNGNNLLLGMDGSDTLIGNGGLDQLNANRDYSPDVDGMPNDDGPAGLETEFDQFDDMMKFPELQMLLGGQPGVSPTAVAIFNEFGIYGFGQGTGDFQADFAFANGLNPPLSADLLNGGDDDDALFGFNNALVTVIGGGGNDIYSTNARGGFALLDMGNGNDTLLYTNGDTVIGGPGNDMLTPAGFDPNRFQFVSFLFGEQDDDTIIANNGRDEIRAGSGNNLIGGTLNGDTVIGEGGNDDLGNADTSQFVLL